MMKPRLNAQLDEGVLKQIADTAYAKGYDDFMAANEGMFPKVFRPQIIGAAVAGAVILPFVLILLGIL
jgi:hypothetical protein